MEDMEARKVLSSSEIFMHFPIPAKCYNTKSMMQPVPLNFINCLEWDNAECYCRSNGTSDFINTMYLILNITLHCGLPAGKLK